MNESIGFLDHQSRFCVVELEMTCIILSKCFFPCSYLSQGAHKEAISTVKSCSGKKLKWFVDIIFKETIFLVYIIALFALGSFMCEKSIWKTRKNIRKLTLIPSVVLGEILNLSLSAKICISKNMALFSEIQIFAFQDKLRISRKMTSQICCSCAPRLT